VTATSALLLDVDGTLVDSTYVHVRAWGLALSALGERVAAWRVHRAIGMGSPQLLEHLLGAELADRLGEQAVEGHSREYAALSEELRPLPGARELVRELTRRGVRPVLATSASPEELERLRAVLDVEEELHAVTAGGDVESAKPAPDIVGVALERAGVRPEEAIFVGDAVWDVEAAGRAGVRCVGVLSGGIGAAELRDAGAVRVVADPADLLAHLDELLG